MISSAEGCPERGLIVSQRIRPEWPVRWFLAMTASLHVMPGPVPGIHVFQPLGAEVVDGRDKPGHDGKEYREGTSLRA
jgi:hypothetical protein